MKLIAIEIENFRGYQHRVKIPIDNLTTFIGKNDAGKSTVFEALEIFFNNKLVVADNDDFCVHSESDSFIISCEFSNLPDQILIDENVSTTLESEYLLNKNGNLTITKIYSKTKTRPKEDVFIYAYHPMTPKYDDLLSLTNSKLKSRAKELGVIPANLNTNKIIRESIWRNAIDLNLEERLVAISGDDTKTIYSKLNNYLPVFTLFQSDRTSNDGDSEITEPMQVAVKEALKEVAIQLEEIKKAVEQHALNTADKTLRKLAEMDPSLANRLIPEFKAEPKFDSQFKLTIRDENVPINKRGSGVRRLILLNFFRAQAEDRLSRSNNDSIIYAFEEPETSQHPSNQKMLIESFLELSKAHNTQVLLTTHTPDIGGIVPKKSLRFITEENNKKIVKFDTPDVYNHIVETLGLLPEYLERDCKGIIFVEGKDDIIFLTHIANELSRDGFIEKNIQEAGLTLIPMGGCDSLKFWVQSDFAVKYKIPFFVFLDSDKGTLEEKKQHDRKRELEASGIVVSLTRKREIENYIHPSLIPTGVNISDTCDAKKILAEKLNIRKKKVMSSLISDMTTELIRDMEEYEEDNIKKYEFTDFFQKIYSSINSL